jgi:hypothetical protein
MPSVSGAQHRAMEAAKHGESTLGIPQSVGADFSAADEGNPAAKGTKHKDFTDAMKSHGVAKGDGKHKRHPSTSHYGMGSRGNRYGK